jgi:CBS domain-containing protein
MARGPIVGDVMTQVVVTVAPDTQVRDFVKILVERGISGAPIVDERGQVLGVVSATNVLRAQAREEPGYYDEAPVPARFEVPADEARTVREIGTARVVSLDEATPLPQAAKLMLELGIRRVVVTRRGRFAGILTATDIMKWVARPALEEESEPELEPRRATRAARARRAKGKA